jgi:cell division protein FtsB
MSDKVSVSDILISWVLFWVLAVLGLIVLAGVVLVPLWHEQCRLTREYQVTDLQIAQIEEEVARYRGQLAAIWVDPQYTERIARNELNLRKAGEETLQIQPLYLASNSAVPILSTFSPPRDYTDRWWYRIFLDQKQRRWYLILAGGFLATAVVTAVAMKDRRRAEIGLQATGCGLRGWEGE